MFIWIQLASKNAKPSRTQTLDAPPPRRYYRVLHLNTAKSLDTAVWRVFASGLPRDLRAPQRPQGSPETSGLPRDLVCVVCVACVFVCMFAGKEAIASTSSEQFCGEQFCGHFVVGRLRLRKVAGYSTASTFITILLHFSHSPPLESVENENVHLAV